MAETVEQAKARYQAAMHAMQSGVAGLMAFDRSDETMPKHLRVGVNSALIGSSAVAHLLIDKGVITEAEYFAKSADLAEADRDDYVRRIEEITGTKVTLQ